MFKNSSCLFEGNSWKQIDNLADGDAVLQVLEKGRDRHPGAPKHPCSAYALGIAFHCGAA